MYRFPWYLTLVSTNHASSNPGQDVKYFDSHFFLNKRKNQTRKLQIIYKEVGNSAGATKLFLDVTDSIRNI